MKSIFLSHSSQDRSFVRRLAADLKSVGIRVWFDDAELRVGDSLVDRIGEAISDMDAFGVVLSNHSIRSKWVQVELKMGIMKELNSNAVVILPILIEKVPIPQFLADKVYADFTQADLYDASFRKVIYALNVEMTSPVSASSDAVRRLEAIRLAINVLQGTPACYFAPFVPAKVEGRVRLKCKIPHDVNILAVVTRGQWFFNNRGKYSIVFTDTGVFANSENSERVGFKPYEEFKKLNFGYTTRPISVAGAEAMLADTEYLIELGFDNLTLPFPPRTVMNVVNLLNAIKAIVATPV